MVKNLFAVRCRFVDLPDHFIATSFVVFALTRCHDRFSSMEETKMRDAIAQYVTCEVNNPDPGMECWV